MMETWKGCQRSCSTLQRRYASHVPANERAPGAWERHRGLRASPARVGKRRRRVFVAEVEDRCFPVSQGTTAASTHEEVRDKVKDLVCNRMAASSRMRSGGLKRNTTVGCSEQLAKTPLLCVRRLLPSCQRWSFLHLHLVPRYRQKSKGKPKETA